jgi:hypothetical protein
MKPFYDIDSEFMKRRIQLINSEAVLRIRELRIHARTLFPFVTGDMQKSYLDSCQNATQIAYNMDFLLDMFDVDPLPSVSVEFRDPDPKETA